MLTPKMKPRFSTAQLIRDNSDLRKRVTYEAFMSEAKDKAQREWVDERIKQINITIRESNKPKDKKK